MAEEVHDWLRGFFTSSSGYVIEVWFACFMFIEIPSAASNVAVAYKTPACAAVATLRTSSVNEHGQCFLLPPLTIIMAAFGTNDAVTIGVQMVELEKWHR